MSREIAEAIERQGGMPAEATGAVRKVESKKYTSFAMVNEDGSIECSSKGAMPDPEELPEGIIAVEGAYDPKTDRFQMPDPAAQGARALSSPIPEKQTTMESILTVVDGVPADGVSVASITGIPPKTIMRTEDRFLISETINDGELTLTFDTPGDYAITFVHKGWLETVITLNVVPVSSP